MEKRYIELNVVAETDSQVFFKVRNTKHNEEFNNGKQHFDASNGIALYSMAYPSWDGKNKLFLLGKDSRLDEMIVITFTDDFERIQQAVKEYNKKFELPEFIFRVSLDKIGKPIEDTLNELKQDTSWKEMVRNEFKVFAGDVLPADAKYTIDCIQVNDKIVFTEFEYYDANENLKKLVLLQVLALMIGLFITSIMISMNCNVM